MAAKYAAVITYDNIASYAMAIAVKDALAATRVVDSGQTTYRSIGELNELRNGHIAAGFATNPLTIVATASLLATAQANALTLAGTL
jgi:hypothetical protein